MSSETPQSATASKIATGNGEDSSPPIAGTRSVFAQELLPEFERKLRQLSEASPDFLAIIDCDLTIAFANHALGSRSPSELEGTSLIDLFPAKSTAAALAAVHEVLASGIPGRFSFEVVVAGAIERYFEVRVSPIWQDGRVSAVTLSSTETTEQVRAQRAISLQSHMIESMLEGVALVTAAGVIEITNPSFDAVFGYARGDLIGQEIGLLLGASDEHCAAWTSLLGQMAQRRNSARLEFSGRQRGGKLLDVAGVLSRFVSAEREHFLLVLRDVSERKQLERALIEAVNREQYRIGNDLHDGLGQELTGIALMLRGLAGRLGNEYPAVLPDIEEITRLLSNAVESTRALARGLSPVNLERGGLADALDGLAVHARDLYGIEVACTHHVPGSLVLEPEVANHLYRIAQEALTNAVRHGEAKHVSVHLTCTPRKVRLAVSDDGVGIADNAAMGPGMGLKIMRYRARIARGELRVERIQPRGTRVLCDCSMPARPKRTSRGLVRA